MRLKFPTPPPLAAASSCRRASTILGLALAGCITTTTSQPAGIDRAILTAIPVSRAWLAWEDGSVIGSVVRYSEPEEDGRFLYVVRNLWDQDLGMIDDRGRTWKRIPHEEDRWIGTGTIIRGVRQILETGEDCRLAEVPVAEAEAATAAARAL